MFAILEYPFMQYALLTGAIIAVIAAVTGYFLIARGLTFAGHALPNVGFAGAAGAVLLGLNPVLGLFVFTVGAAVGIGLLGSEARERDTSIGVIMTFALGLGFLFVSLYAGNAQQVYAFLFGQIVGITAQDSVITLGVGAFTLLCMMALYRPLLFSSFDPQVAEARGLPVRALSIIFLALVAITVSLAVQIVGALFVFTLLVGPAATAVRIASSPISAILLAIALGVLYTIVGIYLAGESLYWPVSFFIAAISFGVYLLARFLTPGWRRRRATRGVVVEGKHV
jgi:zinc/manganese transport system permease protein